MKQKNPLLVPELRELLQIGDAETLEDFVKSAHPEIIADFISALSPEEAWQVLKYAEPSLRGEIFSRMEEEIQSDILSSLAPEEIAHLFTDMPPDDRADLFKKLPDTTRENILRELARAEREDIRRLAGYKEGTAGAIMTSEYAALPPYLTVTEAIEQLRQIAPDKETIYYAYIIDEKRKLLGFVSLKDLILAPRDARVQDIMHTDVIFVRVDEDQEEAARKIQKYDLLALPVLNGGDALVGIITHDDALDIITQEHTEDMEKFMAIAGSHEAGAYLRTPAWVHFKNRAYWVVSLAALGLVSGVIIHHFETVLMQLLILALYMPMVADTGGNVGSQSATVVVRALALKEITPGHFLRVITKEFKIAAMLSLVLGILSFGKVMFLSGNVDLPPGYTLPTVGLVIAFALSLQVITATVIGALLPLAAARLKLDPAVIASPALTTIVDITGLLLYFGTAKLLLSL